MREKKLAHILALLLMLIWGLSYLSIKVIIDEGVNPMLSTFYRFAIASIVLYTILKIKYPEEKILKEDKFNLALGGFLGITMFFSLQNWSVAYTSASNVAILLSAIPIFMLIFQTIVFKEKLVGTRILGTCFSTLGILIIILSKDKVSLFSTGTKGDLMAISAALSWVLYNAVTSKLKGNYKNITITTYQMIWGCIFLSPSLFIFPISIPTFRATANLFYLSLICSCIGFMIYIYCLEHLGATMITTYINLQPIITLISAAFILKEDITLYQIIGCLVIVLGVFLVSYEKKVETTEFQELI